MVIVEIAVLALSFSIVHHVCVWTLACHLVSSENVVTSVAHAFSVVFCICVFTSCDCLCFSSSFWSICFLLSSLFNRLRFFVYPLVCVFDVFLKLLAIVFKLDLLCVRIFFISLASKNIWTTILSKIYKRESCTDFSIDWFYTLVVLARII